MSSSEPTPTDAAAEGLGPITDVEIERERVSLDALRRATDNWSTASYRGSGFEMLDRCLLRLEATETALTAARAEAATWAAVMQEPDNDTAPFPVYVARMIHAGYSYDAQGGVWWSDDNKPGILRQVEAERDAARAEVERLTVVLEELASEADHADTD